jgi:phosphoglycerate dehydrogenase-like enzyme
MALRVTYHGAALQGVNLKEHCADLDFAECTGVDSLDDLIDAVETSEVLMFNNPLYTAELAEALKGPRSAVKWLQLSSTGFDKLIDLGLPEDIIVTNAASIWAPIVAEHACSLMLALLRGLHHAERKRAAKDWDRSGMMPELSSLEGARVGILGFGTIGKEIARRAKAFDAEIIALVRRPGDYPNADEVIMISDVMGRLATVDVLICALPLSPATKCLLDWTWFNALPESAIFINVGRGACVQQDDLRRALAEGQIAGAGLDVAEVEPMPVSDPLWTSDRLILTPHIATMGTRKGHDRAVSLYRANIIRFYQNEQLMNLVMDQLQT